jgi:L-threonylcarbamoyladenylate synthase
MLFWIVGSSESRLIRKRFWMSAMRTLIVDADEEDDVAQAGEMLRDGLLVAFPTETVYGLGARADDEAAVEALYRVKRRPRGKKCAILIPDPEDAGRYTGGLQAEERWLAEAFWPGPLTLVVGKGHAVGVRCPDCGPTRRMLRAASVPVYAPSANLSGHPPARNAREVMDTFSGLIAAVLDGGHVTGGVPSTVVRILDGEPQILRAGAIAPGALRRVIAGGECRNVRTDRGPEPIDGWGR